MDQNIVESTLGEVTARLGQDANLTSSRRRDIVSSVVRMCELTGVDPVITPASMQFMRPLINAVRPARHGFNSKTWSNLRSNFRTAIVGPAARQQRQRHPEWTRLHKSLPNARMKQGLCRFIGFCEENY